MNSLELINQLQTGKLDAKLSELYGLENVTGQTQRYINTVNEYVKLYGDNENIRLFSVSGRTEISGNHTDHNLGRVVAGAINLDVIAVVTQNTSSVVRLKSEGFDEDVVDLSTYTTPNKDKFFSSESIIAGTAARFRELVHKTGGFTAYTTSNVFKGSGLSSSAAFEVMVGTIFSHLYNNGSVSNIEIAKIAQYAENEFFGKPCGLMDQMACAVGGIITIDFADNSKPIVESLNFDLSKFGYKLCIVNTGGNHADLNDDYASVPAEMKAVAKLFGKTHLRGLEAKDVISKISELREKVGDRAIMRSLHFFAENKRVEKLVEAIKNEDLCKVLSTISESGQSSFNYLQNVYTTKNIEEQGISLALCVAQNILTGTKSAWRVHGGGFAGTIQVFLPNTEAENFKTVINSVFGENACYILNIRKDGASLLV